MSNDNLTLAEASFLFEEGALLSFRVERYPLATGWTVQLVKQDRHRVYLCDARSCEPRVFRTFEAACNALERVGFKVVALIPA